LIDQRWKIELRRIILTLSLAIFIGWIFDVIPWALAFTLMLYSCWQRLQTRRLQLWLESSDIKDPPDSHGIWGRIFDDIYRLQRRNQAGKDKLKSVLKRIQDSTEALRDGVLMVNDQGALEWWNTAAQQYLALKESHDINRPVTNLVRDPQFKKYFDDADYSELLEITSPINTSLTLQIHITLFGNNDRLIVIRNITRVKHLELMRQDFVANVSHELRTPLTVIRGYLETYIDNAEQMPPKWLRGMQQMEKQALRMDNLVKDLLLLSVLENGQERLPSNLNIASILEAVIADAKSLSNGQHNIELHLASEKNILGQENEIRSAFSNLVFNAVKYTPAGSNIDIHWREDTQGLYLDVIDDGDGIEPQHLSRLTERFYRVDASRNNATGGTGLGLAIVKHTLALHNATLSIESEIGSGSLFSCHFPAQQMIEDERY
jgi:two-component system phosphate regulon sensor histidine kinase PhoR